ncbi:ferrous iron transport protein A [Acidihalobacter ferrooxydans]|uniref:Ferrous iron transport protein A n=1 Tax=Acidihalobacter ferrooxydans TaxID=1765967 RepID=A0A1P8ULL0_9GAMM|nr:ferrous iron transport protein A [Acidihalobacter ferrooxydans]
MTLAELKVGETGKVLGFDKSEAVYRRRLLAMGLTPRTEFTVVRVAPLGDPVEIRVRGSALALRKDEARALRIERG